MARRAETTAAECSLTSCVWVRFLIGSHTTPGQRHSQPTPTRWIEGACVLRWNLSPALLAQWPGSFTCHCGNMGAERTPSKSQHRKLTLEKKILPPFLPGLATFRSRVRRSTNNLPRLHLLTYSRRKRENRLREKIRKTRNRLAGISLCMFK